MAQLVSWLVILSIVSVGAFAADPDNEPSVRPGLANATESYYHEQTVDHFTWNVPAVTKNLTWSERFFVYDQFWDNATGPIFFYAGNEGDVELYVNYTGWMWEQGEAMNALLIFAEHRYYGKSNPVGPPDGDAYATDPTYLSVEQALADYVQLIYYVKNTLYNAKNAPVVAFGGSYGGMLAAWLRLKYPATVYASLAASAPIAAFPGAVTGYDPESYWAVVTNTASPAAGASAMCRNNTRRVFDLLFDYGETEEGLATLTEAFSLCEALNSTYVVQLGYWIQGAYDSFAMGNYPFKSAYIAGDYDHPMPPWPMRVACDMLADEFDDSSLLQAMGAVMNFFYNITEDQPCYDVSSLSGPASAPPVYLYQTCTEGLPQEEPFFPTDGIHDMFWDQGLYNATSFAEYCQSNFGVTPRPNFLPMTYGGWDVTATSNIIFSNGGYDPWHSGGVLRNISENVVAVFIENGGHHVDLFFTSDQDTPEITTAREIEKGYISKWLSEYNGMALNTGLEGGVAAIQSLSSR